MSFEHLDPIVSFVTILAGVSLLVTTLRQMILALLGRCDVGHYGVLGQH